MELVDILVLGTSAERRAGSNPAEGKIDSACSIFSKIRKAEICIFFLKNAGAYENAAAQNDPN